jgi:hypothetical protein
MRKQQLSEFVKIGFFPPSYTARLTFFSASPCIRAQSSGSASSGTSDGLGAATVWPSADASA